LILRRSDEFHKGLAKRVRRFNASGRTTVHTIAFPYNMGQDILTQIAGDSGGQYRFVAEENLGRLY